MRLLLAGASLLGGCAVGPDYARPSLPSSDGFSPRPWPAQTDSADAAGGAAQRFVTGSDLHFDWWTQFRSPALDKLVALALATNPTITRAQAALRAAQHNIAAQRGLFFPTVQAGYSPSRNKIAGNLGGNSPGVQGNGVDLSTGLSMPASEGGTAPFSTPLYYSFHTASLTVGFIPDVFGGNRRQVESLEAMARHQQLELEATYVTLVSNVVAAAIQEALLRDQIATTERIIETRQQSIALLQRRLKAGYASRLDLKLQEQSHAQAVRLLPPLRKQYEQTRNLLRTLAGGVQDSELFETFELASLELPRDLPLSLPSQVIEQRPDVRAAEEQLRAASAQVGVAIANRLPHFSIDASWGGAASRLSQMFWSSGKFFELTGTIAQPLFDGGALSARQRAAEEELRGAEAQYRSTVLHAFQDIADVLQAIHADTQTLKAVVELERTAGASLELMRRQLSHGYIDRIALLEVEQTHAEALLALSEARAARLANTAALFQALGGGWWHRDAADTQQASSMK